MKSSIFKSIIIAGIFAIVQPSIFGQTVAVCGVDFEEQHSTRRLIDEAQNMQFSHASFYDYVPIKFHIIAANNGAFAIDSIHVFNELEIVNNLFEGSNIEFIHCGRVNYIFDNNYVTFIKNVDETICDIHDQSGAINIYFAPILQRENGDDLCGYAYNYDIKQRLIMDNGCSTNGSTLAHELGHLFSLLHTHSTSHGVELVNGSNCTSSGDLFCDTPADPRLSSDIVNSSCVYTGTILDPNEMPYDPDTGNLMSYSRKNCRDHFSPEQLLQIEMYHFLNSDLLECQQDSASSVEELTWIQDVVMYPNPTSGVVYLRNVPANARITLFNSSGALLYDSEITQVAGHANLEFIKLLENGVYYIRIAQRDGISIKKLIKI